MDPVRDEQEIGSRRRFLEILQECVRRIDVEGLRGMDHDDLGCAAVTRYVDEARKVADLLDHDTRPRLARCRHIALPEPDPEAAVAWLGAQGTQDPALALAHTGNAPLLAQALGEGDFWQRRTVFLSHVATHRFDPLSAAEDVSDYPLRDVVSWLQKWTFDLVLQKCLGKVRYNPDYAAAIAALSARLEPVTMLRFHREVLKLQRVIDHPLNPRLLLEQLMLDYGAALNRGAIAS